MTITVNTVEGDNWVNGSEDGDVDFSGTWSGSNNHIDWSLNGPGSSWDKSGQIGVSTNSGNWNFDLDMDGAPEGSYTLTVDLDGDGAGSASVTFVIDRTSPSMTSSSTVNVPENTTTTTTFYQATANETVTWSIKNGNDSDDFTITSDGKLKFAAVPDYENPADGGKDNEYKITLVAKDAAGNVKDHSLTVNVTNVAEDTTPPTVNSIQYGSNDGTLRAGESVTFTVKFSEVVNVTGSPRLSLNTGGAANYSSGSGTDTLTFTYLVAAGQNTGDLTVSSLQLNGGTIRDGALNNATLPGSTINPSGTLVVDTKAPTVESGGSFSIAENTSTGTTIYAADADETVTWSLLGTDAGDFTLGVDGKLRFATSPDFEGPADNDTNNKYEITIRATDAAGNFTDKSLTVTVTDVNEDTTPPAAPSIDLSSADDTGVSNSDNITSKTSGLTITGAGEANAKVTIYRDTNNDGDQDAGETILATTTVSGGGSYSADISLANGKHNVRAFLTDAAGNKGASSDLLAITVDNQDPSINGSFLLFVDENFAGVVQDYNADETVTWSLAGEDADDFVITSDGKLSFKTPPDYENPTDGGLFIAGNNIYSLDIVATDAAGNSSSQLALVFVSDVDENKAPVATADSYTATEDTVLTVNAANGVLKNDSDADKDTLTAQLVSGPANGTLTLNANGSFTYQAKANYNGPDSFTYKASDGQTTSGTTTVTLNVTPVNDAPSGVGNVYTLSEDTTLSGTSVLGNDTDVENDPLTAVLGTTTSNGTLIFNSDGTFTYTPNADFFGTDSFTYKAKDSSGAESGTTTVTLNVTAINDAPNGTNDSYDLSEDSSLTVPAPGVLVNDTDVDSVLQAVLDSGPANGTLSLTPDGAFTYTPDADFNGVDSFVYKANDGSLSSGPITVTITVHAVNDAPKAPESNTVATTEDTPSTAVAIGATDIDGDALTYTVKAGSGPAKGSVSFDAGKGTFVYTPNADANGADSFTIEISDGTAPAIEQAVTVSITPVNDAPTAPSEKSVTTNEDTPSAPVAIGAADVDGDTLTYTVKAGAGPAKGSVVFDASKGTFTYVPSLNANGADSFTIEISDGIAPPVEQVVTVNINPLNDAPVAPSSQSVSTNEDTPVGPISFNASDVDGDTLTYTYNGESSPQLGVLSINQAAGTFSFTPNANANGVETLKFLISDLNGGLIEQTVTLTVNPVNDAPTAPSEKSINVIEDTASGPVAIGAADVDGDTLTYSLAEGGPAKGTVTFDQAAGTFVYTPNAEVSGTDSFRILVSDGNGGLITQIVNVNIGPANDAPTAVDDTLATRPEDGGAFTVAAATLLANDTSLPDVGETLTITSVGAAVGGTVSLVGSTITFTPTKDFNGPASFEYTVSDGNGGTDVGVASFAVTPVDDAPAFGADASKVSTPENQTTVGTFAAVDPDGGALTYSLIGKDAGLFVIDKVTGALSFVDAPDFETMPINPVFVSIVATDATGLSDQLDLTVEVSDVAESQPEGPPPLPPPPNPNPGGEQPDPQLLLEDAFRNIMRYPVNDEYRPRVDELTGKVEDGDMTLEQAIGVIIDWADATTSVATLTYQFFTGSVPTFDGLDWLVAPDGPNPNSLNEDYYAKFNYDSRYINFAVNLGKTGLSGQAFALEYGALTMAQATKAIYAEVFGFAADDAKVAELLNGLVSNGMGGTMTREAYLRLLGGDEIGAKAAMAGFLLGHAALADVGVYGGVNEAFLLDIADGGTYDVDIVGVYEGGLGG